MLSPPLPILMAVSSSCQIAVSDIPAYDVASRIYATDVFHSCLAYIRPHQDRFLS